ncbi:MAG: hypothetical protein M5U09_13730 [Gammaproteobacteria bacterium]|nr:hypothetical protein [Gammaproteobacteria bacterium]
MADFVNRHQLYCRKAAALDAFRRGRFWYWDTEETPNRAELWLDADVLMEGYFGRFMRRAFQDFGSRLQTPTFPVVDALVRTKAVTFKESAVFELIDPETRAPADPETYADTGVPRLRQILETTGTIAALDRADEQMVAGRTSAVWVKFGSRPRTLDVQALPGYVMAARANRAVPWDPRIAERIAVPATGDAYPEVEDLDDELWFVYAYTNGRYWAAYVSGAGEPITRPGPHGWEFIDPPESRLGLLRVQAHPVIVWKEDEYHPGVFSPLPKPVHDGQVESNVNLAVCQLAFCLGPTGSPTSSGRGARSRSRTSGSRGCSRKRTSRRPENAGQKVQVAQDTIRIGGQIYELPVVPEGWKMAVLQARADPVQFLRYAEAGIKRVFVAEEMVPTRIDLLNPQPANYSGTAREVDARPQEAARQRREAKLARYTVRTLDVVRAYWNIVCAPEDRIPEHLQWRITFQNVFSPNVLYDQSSMQGVAEASKLGLIDPVDVVAQLYNLDPAEAEAKWKRAAGRSAWLQRIAQQERQQSLPPGGPA